MIFDLDYFLLPWRWPPGLTLLSILEDPTYRLALHYLSMNLLLALTALLWGAGFTLMLMKFDKSRNTSIEPGAFSFICMGSGFAIIMAEIFLLIAFQSLNTSHLRVTFIATSLASLYLIVHNRKRIPITSVTWPDLFISLFFFSMLTVYQISSAASWMLGDSTSYHVPYADFFLLNKGLAAIPEHLIYPYHALNIDLLYSLGLLLDRDLSYLQTIHAVFATLTLWGTFIFCRLTSRKLLLAVLSIFILSQVYIIHYTRLSACVDLGSMYFMLCCYFSLYLWSQTKSSWLLISSAISFGIAIGAKYLMCVFALPIAMTIIINQHNRQTVKSLAIYAAWSALFGLWWYIRNAIYAGNPVHPFASSVFGLYLWDESDVLSQAGAVSTERIPRTLAGFFLMPYFAGRDIVLVQQGANIFVYLLFLSTVFSAMLDKKANCLLATCWIYAISWFFGTQDPRHLEPIMPLLLVYCGLLVNAIFSEFFHLRSGKIASGIAVLSITAYLCVFIQQQFMKVFSSSIGDPAANEINMRQLPSYDIMTHANEIFGTNATVFEFHMRDARWFFKGNLVGNQFGPHGYARVMNSAMDDSNTLISAEKLKHILYGKYHANGFVLPLNGYIPYDINDLNSVFHLEYQNEMGAIYRIK